MNKPIVPRFVEGLLKGRPTERARPDDADAQDMKTAIELRAARLGSDAPREEFVTGLHRRLANAMADAPAPTSGRGPMGTRRQVVIGTGLAAASAAAGLVVGRALPGDTPTETTPAAPPAQGELQPNDGVWQAVGAGADLTDGQAMAFDLGSVRGFVHRNGPQLRAVSGSCTHQGCALWLDAAAARLRCPCHTTSFSLDGVTLTHQLPIAPAPLPTLQVRETDGRIEVFAPTEPA